MTEEHLVITPESVEFVYELAGLGSRMLAALLDHLCVVAALFAIWIVTLVGGCLTFIFFLPAVALGILASFLVYFGYFAYFEWKHNGQTPGKKWMEIRVIDDRGLNVDLFQAVIRNLLRVVDMMPVLISQDFVGVGLYGLGGISALLSPGHRRLGDWAAGTIVVRSRRGAVPGDVLTASERYNTLYDNASLRASIRSRLTLEERELLLQLCVRRNTLEWEHRRRLFAEAAAYLERRLEIPRDALLSEEKFVQNIAAVAAGSSGGRRRREEGGGRA